MDKQKEIWYSSPSFYEYDDTKDLYAQINDLVNEKLMWYDELLHNINDFYNVSKWSGLSLNMRYAKITTIVNPHIEEDIDDSIDDKATFQRIVFHIPYFIWRDPNVGDIIKYNKNQLTDEIIKNCECHRIKPCHERKWQEGNEFIYTGITLLEMFNVNIDNNKYTIISNEDNIRYKRFQFIKQDSVIDVNDFHANDNDLYEAKVLCDSTTLRNMSNMFANDQMLKFVDLSQCNINYATSFESMFNNCIHLKKVDLSNLDLDNFDPITTNMFTNCNDLKTIILKNCSQNTVDQIKCIVVQCGLDKSSIDFIW